MGRIFKYIWWDIINNKILFVYALLLFVFSWTVFSLEDNPTKGALTLLNILLLVVPLFSLLFTTIYLYRSHEFIELLVSHPIRRSVLWSSLFMGLCLSLGGVFTVGAGLPLFFYFEWEKALLVYTGGLLLTFIFVALGFLTAIYLKDKAKGIAVSVLLWLYLTLLYDGLILFLMFQFSDYPIDSLMVILSSLSPVDLTRIRILMEMEMAAMLSYSGAIFSKYFDGILGNIVSIGMMILWIVIPFWVSLRRFSRKDL